MIYCPGLPVYTQEGKGYDGDCVGFFLTVATNVLLVENIS